MNDYRTMAKILKMITFGQDAETFDKNLMHENIIDAPARKRDRISITLQKEGLIDGLEILGSRDYGYCFVDWEKSRPQLTIKGMEYTHANELYKKAMKEM